MVLCKFFAQGYCRYGDSCRFEHQKPGQGGGRGGSGKSVSFRDTFGQNQNPFKWLGQGQRQDGHQGQGTSQLPMATRDLSPTEIMDLISKEMTVWETSKMWPFSCYTYSKEEPSISGFSDFSPEELRLEGYQARANGTWSAYLQEIENARQKSTSGSGSTFGSPGFGGQSGLFGGTQSSSTGMTQSIFGGGQTQGPSGTATASAGLFGVGSGGQGASGGTTGLFGKPNPTASGGPVTSLFGKPTSTIFGGSSPGVNNSNNTGLFGKTSSGTGLFSSSNQGQGLFGGQIGSPGQGQSVFGGQATFGGGAAIQQSSLFGKPQAQVQGFTQAQSGSQPTQTASHLTQSGGVQPSGFGSPLSQQAQLGGQLPQSHTQSTSAGPHKSRYTPLDQLTDEEKEQFTAAKFTLGKIPTRPPPKELCT
ncbi:nucleoporin-like protein 2 isoform X2 [Lingula anatina]|uniref:Nucleoporin NUP42 n=1 Tax=Lingula anatina TaxID=7574 RepID=A0A1S3J684_LINAN|nr:nucleoporin-like protein 2 isoform X2 [Lingula anatina]|eukprot:XP_013405761.1 nucleoporin-like protein 2 isoform X2 [Lingula anatina]